jgi:hypothetical protein
MIFVAGLASTKACHAESESTPEQVRFFETSIRPLLVDKCQKCHGAEKQWGMLRLDSRDAILRGGESGPAIIPGKSEESRLVQAIRHADDSLKMPPKEKLTESQIADVIRWIGMGAPFPAATENGKRAFRNPNHWAFQPVRSSPPPKTKDSRWSSVRWDQFVLKKLEVAEIPPTKSADPRKLIRRVTYDLTGLPPTPNEVAEFIDDVRPDAFARLIDRLLASPAYGERWGRHWLDVARYADSNGLDENVAHGNAWRYRDYVVAAFNEDRPYTDFLTEQLAGDLLPADNDDQRCRLLTATGFLSLGPKVLAEVDETKMEMDIIDEQVDTVGRAVLGLTLGCARCHDHKFDPIETADYYGLAGIFKSTKTMEHFKKVARWHENFLPSNMARAQQAVHESQVVQQKAAIQALVERADAGVKSTLQAGEAVPEKLEDRYSDETKSQLKTLRDELAELEKTGPDLPTAMGVSEGTVVDVAIHIRGNPLKLGNVVPRRVPNVLTRQELAPVFEATRSGRLELARWLTDPENPLTSRVFVNRVWRWHFGKGLVRSVDNFGLQSENPSHPELLDSLARHFVDSGWSLKRLHRHLLESSTYRLDSQATSGRPDRDHENRLLGRFEIRRLEAEEVRDAMIAVGDGLDRRLGNSLLTVKNRAYFFDHTSKDLTDYSSQRRSIYLPVVRNNVYDVFQLLDFPDAAVPSGDRPTTTIAPQALLMMNSEFVMKCSAEFAATLLDKPSANDESRIQQAYLRAFGREPTIGEVNESLTFLKEIGRARSGTDGTNEVSREKSWQSLCHVIVSSNEFIYVK